MGLLNWIHGKRGSKQETPFSLVLLMRKPFFLGEEALRSPAERAFNVPYDGSDEMHCIVQGGDNVFLKAGPYLITVFHKWGAYLGQTEDDVQAGAARLPPDVARFWREQKAWAAFDLQNRDIAEAEAMRALAKLVYETADERCCGIFVPATGSFFPNDGTAEAELLRMRRNENGNTLG
jgi:hypothetical protein